MHLRDALRQAGTLLALTGFLAATGAPARPAHTFAIGQDSFLLDGKPFQIRCGEIHSARVPREYWRHRLRMAKAMGLNTVCAYLFWNQIELEPGQFNWSGQAAAAEFCQIAQDEGLWVILRPGPYSCAEWEMGGTPWWLLKDDCVQLRTMDPRYLGPAQRYLREVARVFGPLQITHGGPILMVQVENEYGSYGTNTAYLESLRRTLIDSGIDVPLFDCDPTADLKKGFCPNLFPVVNFGSDPAQAFAALRHLLPRGPLMCGEFYPGWFDTWGAPHHLGNTPRYLADLDYMLSHGESFSIYMAHGGTTFGFWSGADRPFKPDTSSYDYDAPISEAGWPTEKFFKTRELFSKYLAPGETLPEPPPRNPVITFGPVTAQAEAPVFDNLPAPIEAAEPRTMEDCDQAHGCLLYRAELPAGPPAKLQARAVHDFGFVYLDGHLTAIMDRRDARTFTIPIPARTKATRLDILVEAMGRINFGPQMHDHKGLIGPVKLLTETGGQTPGPWRIYKLPLDRASLERLRYGAPQPEMPGFWRATFDLSKVGDTFLDLRGWSKGVVWLNGHCLGRFWDIGPTQTAYAPGPWLQEGSNEIIVLDLLGSRAPRVAGLDQPILNQLHPELDFTNLLLARPAEAPLPASNENSSRGNADRAWMVDELTRIAGPVLTAEAQGALPTRLPKHDWEQSREKFAPLEALGRTLAGIAPWLELGPNDTPEGRARARFLDLAVKSIAQAVNPGSPGRLNFHQGGGQPLVDAAFFAQGLLRAPTQLWGRLDAATKSNVVAALQSTRSLKPPESNWLLFPATIEAALWQFTGEGNLSRIDYAVKRMFEWYKGDGVYGDGPEFHWDYYNSYVIQPMLLDVLRVCRRKGNPLGDLYPKALARARRYAAEEERLISPEGTFPVMGRSSSYRFAAFQTLAQMALFHELPEDLPPGQARAALSAVMRRMLDAPATFDDQGWLNVGVAGHQPSVREGYISTGSLYLCTVAFLPLGLPADSPFWQAPAEDWTQKKIWSGQDIPPDHALREKIASR